MRPDRDEKYFKEVGAKDVMRITIPCVLTLDDYAFWSCGSDQAGATAFHLTEKVRSGQKRL